MFDDTLNESIHTAGVIAEDAVLNTSGTVLGAIELSGIEPSSVTSIDRKKITFMLRNLIQRLPVDVVMSQYYFHQDDVKIRLRERDNKRSQLVSRRREAFLNNKRNLNASRLYWVLEVPPEENLNKLLSFDTLQLLFSSLFDPSARDKLKSALSMHNAVLVEYRELKRQIDVLRTTIQDIDTRLSFVSLSNKKLNKLKLWGLQKALVNLDASYLVDPPKTAPSDRWDALVANGQVKPVIVDGEHYLKIEGSQAVYAKIASITGCGAEYMPEAAWCSDGDSPVMKKGNYLFFTRFRPLSTFKKNKLTRDKSSDIHRQEMRVMDLVKGEASILEIENRIEKNPRLKGLLEELEDVKNSDDRFGISTAMAVVFDTDLTKLKQQIKTLKNSLENAQFSMIWESVGLQEAYKNLLLANPNKTLRDAEVSTSQAAALSLIFKAHEGLPEWELAGKKEEAVYVFESEDGTPFHFSMMVGDKCLIIGVGPTRSGKSFLKNCVASHFSKLGGMYCAMDIDKGTEPIAQFFQDDGAIFRLEDASTTKGFNPFAMAKGADDERFISHMNELIRLMLATNDSQEMQSLDAKEQLELDDAIKKVIALEQKELKNFSGMLSHCNKTSSIIKKLARFKKGGVYGNLFDNEEDAVGVLDRPFSVYNTQGVKDSPKLAQLVNTEIFYRAVSLFEDPKYREKLKFLDVDECQYVLSKPGAAEFLVAKARTWFKHGGGMGFWTQSPKHYSSIPEWGTLRSAATSFMFMPDPEMDKAEYLEAFPFLTEEECSIIANMQAKKQCFIKQPDIGVAKVINLHVEAEQYVVTTSRPHEAALAERVLKEEKDIDKAVSKIIQALGMEETQC